MAAADVVNERVSGEGTVIRLTGFGGERGCSSQDVAAWWAGSGGGGQADDLVPGGESDGYLAAVPSACSRWRRA